MSLQKCANLSDCTDRLAHARHGSFRPELLLSMLSGEICLRLKPYLVVKISSDKVTECVLSLMFCRSDCRLCADMVVIAQSGNSSLYHVV